MLLSQPSRLADLPLSTHSGYNIPNLCGYGPSYSYAGVVQIKIQVKYYQDGLSIKFVLSLEGHVAS